MTDSDTNALRGVSGNSVTRQMAESAHGGQTAAFSMLLRGNHIQATDWLSETVPTATEVTAGVTSAMCDPSGQFNMCACFPFLRVPKQKGIAARIEISSPKIFRKYNSVKANIRGKLPSRKDVFRVP